MAFPCRIRAPRGDDPLHHVAVRFELDDEGVPQRLVRAEEQQALLAQPRLDVRVRVRVRARVRVRLRVRVTARVRGS